MYGEQFKIIREEKGYSQSELAKHTGISQQNISFWENNKRLPSIDFCVTLAKFYGCTLDELVGLSEIPNEYKQNITLPTKLQQSAIAFAKDFGDMFTDKNYKDMSKLYKAITPELRALTLGYIVGLLQSNGVNTKNILGY